MPYVSNIRNYNLFHNKKHSKDLGVDEIRYYLTHLAVDKNVVVSTQNVALVRWYFFINMFWRFIYRLSKVVLRTKKSERLRVVFTPEEAAGKIIAEFKANFS